ncbi:MAG: site-2 protease family protein [Kofleriaceae bacterium]
MFVTPTASKQKLGVLLVTLGVFAALYLVRGGGSAVDLALIVAVLFVHELGHAAAMLAFGYRDVRIFFIPLLGAATAGRPQGVARWKQAIVLLAGPVPGLVAGVALLYFVREPAWVRHLGAILVIINALNLVPVEPFDGGQLFQVLVFSRNRSLELVFRALTAALVVGVSLYYHQYVLAFVGYVLLATWPHRARVLKAAEQLRDLPADPARLDDDQQRTLHATMWSILPPNWQARWRGKPRPQANVMTQLHDRAVMRPPSWAATSAVLALWAGAMVLAFSVLRPVFAHRDVPWQPISDDAAAFTAELPNDVALVKRTDTMVTYRDDYGLFAIEYMALPTGGDFVEMGRTVVAPKLHLELDGAAEAVGRTPDGHPERVKFVAGDNGLGYILHASPDNAAAVRFFESFHATPRL